MTKLFLIFAGLFMPSELIWSMGASGFLKSILGSSYVIAQPQLIAMVVIVFYYMQHRLRVKKELFFVCALFLSIGVYEYFVTFLVGGHRTYAFQQLIFGFLYPILLIWFLSQLTDNKQLLFFKCFYIGYCAYLLIAILVLMTIDPHLKQQINNYGVGGAIISMRYQTQESLFSLILGNANKQSNYLIFGILLGPLLMGISNKQIAHVRSEIFIFRLFFLLAAFILFVLFSRAAIMLLPIAMYINRRFIFDSSWHAAFIGLIILMLIFRFSEGFTTVLNYLIFTEYVDGTSRGFLGTLTSRNEQWSEIINLLSNPEIFLHGLGVGTYGLLIGGNEWSGSHNLLLDHWLASGLYGVIVLTAITVIGTVCSLLMKDSRLFIGYLFFILLSFREYSFSYLYVTSMGGMYFVLLIYLTFNPRNNKKITA